MGIFGTFGIGFLLMHTPFDLKLGEAFFHDLESRFYDLYPNNELFRFSWYGVSIVDSSYENREDRSSPRD